jgi:hypothetical protein
MTTTTRTKKLLEDVEMLDPVDMFSSVWMELSICVDRDYSSVRAGLSLHVDRLFAFVQMGFTVHWIT